MKYLDMPLATHSDIFKDPKSQKSASLEDVYQANSRETIKKKTENRFKCIEMYHYKAKTRDISGSIQKPSIKEEKLSGTFHLTITIRALRQGSIMWVACLTLGLFVLCVDGAVRNASCPEVAPRELDWKEVSILLTLCRDMKNIFDRLQSSVVSSSAFSAVGLFWVQIPPTTNICVLNVE